MRTFNRYSTIRTDMLDETVRFLTFALKNPGYFPRIPRVRVDSDVRFSEKIKVAFWSTAVKKAASAPVPED